ncbi:MAG: ABC transporter permease [Chloroflexi bacterium]|nr:ABC transporter permease [Chloroflexota bacterium]
MIGLATRNFRQGRARVALTIGGVGLALTLILALDGIFAGSERQITAYLDNSAADVWVSQAGVRNLHMSASALPRGAVEEVAAVDVVASVTPLLYVTGRVEFGAQRNLAYIIGLPPDAAAGRPWQIARGTDLPGPGEAVVDRVLAEQAGIDLGGRVTILGLPLTVVGLSENTITITNSIAFVAFADFAAVRPGDAVSFVLVQVLPGASAEDVAAVIEGTVGGVTAQTRSAFAGQERRVVRDMATDVLTVMSSAGFLIGLAVMALSVYTATLSRRAEYGVLKALGASSRFLYGSVVIQALLGTAGALAVGLAVTVVLTAVVPRVLPGVALAIAVDSVVKVAIISTIIAALAAILPIRQIAGLDPATVFRKGAAP